ncbi:mitochondrial distribution and morphology protein 12 [Aspergillus cavernicola]|uniref:Mitochondrial distribution and morphology protein 12 n=1 Tax=Aspergillus cavernicola TaxID=176166 RepID=A0ABR4IB35_9EURO
MSIEVDWRTATSGPDGEALAERIRSFIHDKFQQVPLPRFIRSVQVHSFEFGTIAPDLEIEDFCEPFADFYEDDEDDDETSEISEELQHPSHDNPWHRSQSDLNESPFREDMPIGGHHPLRDPFDVDHRHHPASPLRSPMALGDHLNPHFLPRAGTPGIPGGTSTLGYHLMSLGGLSGTQTPLAAVAGGSPFNNWSDPAAMGQGNRGGSNRPSPHHPRADADIDSSSPTSRPSTASTHPPGSNKNSGNSASHSNEHQHLSDDQIPSSEPPLHIPPRMRERRPEDVQVLCHAKYAGDIRLSLTAEILLDYPMPSFVGLPLKLNVTGVTFDGVAVIAYIRKRVHFCFLSPEDAEALVGSDPEPTHNHQESSSGTSGSGNPDPKQKNCGLLQEIRVESEIGRKEDGKQVLKNVGKVERFVLAQVRRIFEEELVFPSFYTFLI